MGIGNWELGKVYDIVSVCQEFFPFEILEDFIPIRFQEENVIIGITFHPVARSQVVPGNAIFGLNYSPLALCL